MRAVRIRIAWTIIMLACMGAGLFIASVEIIYPTIPAVANNLTRVIGATWFSVCFVLSIFLCLFGIIDNKEIPIKTISRVRVQCKVLIIIDGVIFEKNTIEWLDVRLDAIVRKIDRNFFAFTLKEEIYIDPERFNNKIESYDIVNYDELDFKDLEHMLEDQDAEEIEEVDFILGEDDEQSKEHDKKV